MMTKVNESHDVPTREEMLAVINEEVADKTLSFGCNIIFDEDAFGQLTITEVSDMRIHTLEIEPPHNEDQISTIIGHPVMIGNVFEYLEKRYNLKKYVDYLVDWEGGPIIEDILTHWKKKIKPIENQSDDCITFVYNLCKQS